MLCVSQSYDCGSPLRGATSLCKGGGTAKPVAGVPGRRMGAAPAQVGHARFSFLFLRRSTTSAESATRLECVTTITHLPI